MLRNLPSLTIQVPLWSHTHTTWAGTKVLPSYTPTLTQSDKVSSTARTQVSPDFLVTEIIQTWCNNKITAWAECFQGRSMSRGNPGLFYSLNAAMSGVLGPCWAFVCPVTCWTTGACAFCYAKGQHQFTALCLGSHQPELSLKLALQLANQTTTANAFLNNQAGIVKKNLFPCICALWEENGLSVLESFSARASLKSLFQAEISRK